MGKQFLHSGCQEIHDQKQFSEEKIAALRIRIKIIQILDFYNSDPDLDTT